MNAVRNITYKDNEHLAVKCTVLHGLGMDGGLFGKAGEWTGEDVGVFLSIQSPALVFSVTQRDDGEHLEGCSPLRCTYLHHSTIRGVEDFDGMVRS